jgi:hypothetical protein
MTAIIITTRKQTSRIIVIFLQSLKCLLFLKYKIKVTTIEIIIVTNKIEPTNPTTSIKRVVIIYFPPSTAKELDPQGPPQTSYSEGKEDTADAEKKLIKPKKIDKAKTRFTNTLYMRIYLYIQQGSICGFGLSRNSIFKIHLLIYNLKSIQSFDPTKG